MKKQVLFLTLAGFGLTAAAQNPVVENPEPKIKFGGFVEYRAFLDDYRSVETRDGLMNYYPSAAKMDKNGDDVNKQIQLQMLSITARFNTKIEGPDAFGAKTTAFIEGDFAGTGSDYVSMIRLRHAYINFNWGNTQVLAGQYWHPTNIPECAPNTLAFGAGFPFHALLRTPQIRVTQAFAGNFKAVGALLSSSSYKIANNNEAQRNSGIPEVQAQMQYANPSVFAAVTGGYKVLKPRFTTTKGYSTDQTVGSYNLSGSLKVKLPAVNISLESTYGTNLKDLNFIGGIGAADSITVDDYGYASLKTSATWIDLETTGSKVKFGLFGGYSQNLGSDDTYISLNNSSYSRNDDLSYVYRVSPRVVFISGKVNIGLEYMLTTAVYGSEFDTKHKVTKEADPVTNNRILLLVKYSF
jgi:hypothetical protein